MPDCWPFFVNGIGFHRLAQIQAAIDSHKDLLLSRVASIDRQPAAQRKVMVCNVPDYGTTEVADHALALALSLRRGIALHLEAQRRPQPAPWGFVRDPLVRRSGVQTFGIVGLGRIGTAAALRAKAFQFRVVACDPYMPNGTELGVGVERVRCARRWSDRGRRTSSH